jgi:hypothetical protein
MAGEPHAIEPALNASTWPIATVMYDATLALSDGDGTPKNLFGSTESQATYCTIIAPKAITERISEN